MKKVAPSWHFCNDQHLTYRSSTLQFQVRKPLKTQKKTRGNHAEIYLDFHRIVLPRNIYVPTEFQLIRSKGGRWNCPNVAGNIYHIFVVHICFGKAMFWHVSKRGPDPWWCETQLFFDMSSRYSSAISMNSFLTCNKDENVDFSSTFNWLHYDVQPVISTPRHST